MMKKSMLLLVATLVLGASQIAAAANWSNPATATTTVTATKAESLSVAASTPPALVISGTSAPAQKFTITSMWNLTPSRNTVTVCAGSTDLAASNASKNPDTIPVSMLQASIDNGSTWAAINAAAGCTQGAVTTVHTYTLTGTTRKSQTVTDDVSLQLVGLDPTLQADTYTGTITVYAYVQ